jgi:hypothetical protein
MIPTKKVLSLKNEQAVLGLPMQLTVSLIIGTVALIAILSYILNPCIFPGRVIVTVSPMVSIISGEEPENVTFTVYVNGTDGTPLSGASVIIKGLGGASAGFTDTSGKALLTLMVQLENNTFEGYLNVEAKVPCHEPFEGSEMIKIVQTNKK